MPRQGRKLPRTFYDRPTLEVAPEFLGKFVCFQSERGLLSARIVEVEAYIGQDDPASHAAPGLTDRNRLMFGQPGFAYIYLIYGMYHCLNFVTEHQGFPAAVLLRAAEPADGFPFMHQPAKRQGESQLLRGPGKFCRAFGLTLEHSGLDLTDSMLYLEDRNQPPGRVKSSPRIGIRKAVEKPWRFFDPDSAAVSGPKRSGRV